MSYIVRYVFNHLCILTLRLRRDGNSLKNTATLRQNSKSRWLLSTIRSLDMFQPIDYLEPKQLPRSVNEVVDILFEDLQLRDRVTMSKMSENELDSAVYLAMAKSIREEFGLYNGNDHLISSCRSYLGRDYDDYEDPAMVIIKELWKKIRENHHLRLVKA